MSERKKLEEAARELEEFGARLCEEIGRGTSDLDLATAVMIEYSNKVWDTIEEMNMARVVIKRHWFTRFAWWLCGR